MARYDKPPVQIRRIEGDPPQFANSELSRLATTYARVFAGDPWNEVSRCQDGFSPLPVGSPCDDCGDLRQEAYPNDTQVQVITGELQRPDAACFVLEDQQIDEIVGFSWGFSYQDTDEFIQQKYAGEGERYNVLRRAVRRLLGSYAIEARPFYYLSETGIVNDPRYRGRGISKEFVRLRSMVAADRGLDIIQRTSLNSPMYRTMQGAGFTQIMGENIDEPDVVNPRRVLFIRKNERNT